MKIGANGEKKTKQNKARKTNLVSTRIAAAELPRLKTICFVDK